jgi:hypothetical protein
MSPDELHARALEDLRRRKAGNLRIVAHHRAAAAEAKAHGEAGIARTLGMLAAHLEQGAALAEAEARDREARHAKWKRAEALREQARKPRRRRTLREAILEALAPLRREGVQFKVALRRWERERIEGLRLRDLGDGCYLVTDENALEDSAQTYTRATLGKLYSLAR